MVQVLILEVPRDKYYPLKNIVHLKQLYFLKSKKLVMISKSFLGIQLPKYKHLTHQDIRFETWLEVVVSQHFVLFYKTSMCHALSNGFEMYKNIPLTSRPSSRFVNFIIDRSWLIHKSRGIKPDRLGDFKLVSVNNSSIIIAQCSFKQLSSNRKQRYWIVVFQVLFISIFVCWNHISFFPFNFPLPKHD